MPFTKGHKINVGRICSEATKVKIAQHNIKIKLNKICFVCETQFQVIPSQININHCSRKCANFSRRGKPSWNKGLKGFSAGENHHWYGRNMSGENNPVYKKDRTQLKHSFKDERRSSIYNTWRRDVCNRDNWKCKISNQNCNGRLEVHHILGFTQYPELRYEINNGITLCHAHHPRKRAEEQQLAPIFQELVKG